MSSLVVELVIFVVLWLIMQRSWEFTKNEFGPRLYCSLEDVMMAPTENDFFWIL